MNTLSNLSLKEAQEQLKTQKITSYALVQSCLDQIKTYDSKIKAYLSVFADLAIEKARHADKDIESNPQVFETQPLIGIPIAIKDNFCTQGLNTTAASKVLENYLPQYDATVVSKLKKAGAIIIGKTNMDAWAHGSSTETSQFFTTHNPWDVSRLPGGSSGGSAAAIAAREAIVAIGSETAGSIRHPSSWCGVVGLKPTYGRISRYGLISMCSSTDCPGPITKTVYDAAMLLNILAGSDSKDATTIRKPAENYLPEKIDLKKMKIGLPKEYFMDSMDKEVKTAVKQAADYYKSKGAQVVEISLLDPKYAVAVYTIIQRSEVSSNLQRFDGIRYGNDRKYFGDEAKRRIMLGTFALSAGYYDQYYKKAQKVRRLMVEDFAKVFKQVNLIIAPTAPVTAMKIGSTTNEPMFGEMQDILVEASSLAGLPGINLNCGFSSSGLPIGMQIIGPQFSEKLIINTAYTFEQATNWHTKKPNLII